MTIEKPFAVLLAIVVIVSIYDIVSNGHSDGKKQQQHNRGEEAEDSFEQFDDVAEGEKEEREPSFKYTKEAQRKGFEDEVEEGEVEEVKIREPAGARGGGAFNPPINMPPVKFAFCVSCGYRQAFEQFAQILREKYPGINVYGENFPPGLIRSVGAQIFGFAKIALIVCIVMGRNPFPGLGMQTPTFFQWMLENKLSSALMLFLFSNAIEGMLQSTGAFEIYIEDERIWSKLESGRVPSPTELIQAIDSHIAIRGGSRFGGAGSFGIDETS